MSKTPIFFHVTPIENLDAILEHGLQVQVGERSQLVGETTPAIYLFTSAAAVDDACMNWLCDYFDEDQELAVLAVEMEAMPASDYDNDFEWISASNIPAKRLQVISEDLLGETESFTQLYRRMV